MPCWKKLALKKIEDLLQPIPENYQIDQLDLPEGKNELETLQYFQKLADKNTHHFVVQSQMKTNPKVTCSHVLHASYWLNCTRKNLLQGLFGSLNCVLLLYMYMYNVSQSDKFGFDVMTLT